MEHWNHSEMQDVLKLFQASHIPPSRSAHVVLSKEDVFYVQDLPSLPGPALKLKELGVMSASTAQEA